ncbi:MAG: hotdog family protein [Spongiibacteraceae bacterium]|jgi:predicted hotdog family 3-hydroxylacyl-ACP dehydratase
MNDVLDDVVSKREHLKQFLPHREPMLLLDEVLSYDDKKASVAVNISNSSPFFSEAMGGVPAWVGLEYMAQAISVWSGSQQITQGVPITIGFLLGSRRYQAERSCFETGARLVVEVEIRYAEESGLSAFDCTIKHIQSMEGGELLASARINAFRPDKPEKILQGVRG